MKSGSASGRERLKAAFGVSRIARISLVVLVGLYLSSIFAGWISPYGSDDESRDHSWAPPSSIHWVLPSGGIRPYVRPVSFTFDDNARRVYVEDTTRVVPVRMFVNGRLFGLDSLEAKAQTLGAPAARLYVLGADARGRDLLSRLLYGGRVSLSIGIVGVGMNLETGTWHQSVLTKLGLECVGWPRIVAQGSVVGEVRVGSRLLPLFAAVGDYQCSQAGALLEPGELSVNISTGSAVIQFAEGLEFGGFQTRPWFDGGHLKTITHIPGGRALNALVRLLSELAEAQGLKLRDPWDYILEQSGRVAGTDLRVDPAFYFSAMGDHGAITNAREQNLTVGHLFRAAFEGMADNYARCARRICPAGDWQRLVFSGGVALKTPQLRQLICERLGQEHRLAPSEEDTLLGLLVLGLAFSARAKSVAEAMSFVKQNYKPDGNAGL